MAEWAQTQRRGASYHLGPNGTPLLEGRLSYLGCAVTNRCAGDDHTIFIGPC